MYIGQHTACIPLHCIILCVYKYSVKYIRYVYNPLVYTSIILFIVMCIYIQSLYIYSYNVYIFMSIHSTVYTVYNVYIPELSSSSCRPWENSRFLSRSTSALSSLISLAFGSSLITALQRICLARSAYLEPHQSEIN